MESQDRRRLAFQLEETAPCSDVFYSRLQPSDEAPHTGEDNLPSWSTLQMLISSRKTLTDTSSIVFDQTSGQPVALLSWCIQLTIVEIHQQTLSHPCSRPPGCPWLRPASHFIKSCLQKHSIFPHFRSSSTTLGILWRVQCVSFVQEIGRCWSVPERLEGPMFPTSPRRI